MRHQLAILFAGLSIFTFIGSLVFEQDFLQAIGLGFFWFLAFALVRPRN